MPDPLVSREDLSDYLGQTLQTSDAALIAVDAASDIVRTLAEQVFNQVDDEEIVLDGTGTDALLLPERPVIDVTDVTENDEPLVADEDYKLNGNGVLLRMPTLIDAGWNTQWCRRTWMVGRQNIVVTYSHGFAQEDLPRDVRMVALSIAARLFQGGTQGTAIEESLGAYSVRYADTAAATDLTKTEAQILRKHKQSRG